MVLHKPRDPRLLQKLQTAIFRALLTEGASEVKLALV
jgi:hypothetical protein